MTSSELRQRLAGHADSEAIGIAITELEARDREIEQAKAREQAWKDTVRAQHFDLLQAKREIAELREHAERLAEALETISEAYAPSNHPEEVARAALAAYRQEGA